MWIWNAVNVGLGILTLFGVYYTYKQVDLIRQESETKKKWATKHAEAFALVSKTQRWVIFPSSQQLAYNVAFSDPVLRQRMETYLVNMNLEQNTLSARVL